jgi:hypothetical protein
MTLWMQLVLAILATWRVTHLLASEDGPADLVVRFRVLLGDSLAGRLMDCFYCLSIWVAAPAALFVSGRPLDWMMTWLAISGAASLLEKLVKDPVAMQPMPQPGQGEVDNVLRIEADAIEEQFGAGNRAG